MPEKKPANSHNRKHWSKKAMIAVISLAVTAAIALAGGLYLAAGTDPVNDGQKTQYTVQHGYLTIGSTASGTSQLGALYQPLAWTPGGTELEVSEIQVSAGDTVKTGDSILQVTADSLAAARDELQAAVSAATAALAQADITYQKGLVTRKAELLANKLLGTNAGQVYNQTLQDLQNEVGAAKEKYTAAQTILADYPALITTKESDISAAQTVLAAARTALGAAQSASQAQQSSFSTAERAYLAAKAAAETARALMDYTRQYADEHGGAATLGSGFAGFLATLEEDCRLKEAALASARIPYDAAKTRLKQAQDLVKTCEGTQQEASADLSALKQDLETLEQQLSQAGNEISSLKVQYEQKTVRQKTESLMAKKTYESSVLTGKNAQTTYELALQDLEQAHASAASALVAARDNLAAFTAAIGDGTIRATQDGLLNTVGYEAGDILAADTPVAVYNDPEALTVAVSVDQADIAEISVGDEISVTFSSISKQAYAGTVAMIQMSSTSSSVSEVNYAVTVAVGDDVSALTGGLTADVDFVSETLSDVLYIEKSVVHNSSAGSYVYLEKDGAVTQTAVVTGAANDQYIVILDGLQEGDVCVAAQTASES